MFNKTKFKKGDRVQLLNNLESSFFVSNIYVKYGAEMVVLSNNHSYRADEVTFYSEPLSRLKKAHDSNLSIIEELKKKLEEINKELSELKDKVIKKDTSGMFYIWDAMLMSSMMGGKQEPEVKTLEERIEELEAKLAKKVKTPRVKKSKTKKKK